MKKTVLLLIAALAAVAAVLALRGEGHDHHGHEEAETPRGPHGGRLLSDGDFQVEVTIHERGVPPQSRVYCYADGKPLDPASVELAVELHRLDRVDSLAYRKEGDYLLGDRTVEEPHSFEVRVRARHAGREHAWTYDAYEGRTELTPEAVAASGIVVEEAGPAVLRVAIQAYGRVLPDGESLQRLGARFAGVLKETRKRLGDSVAAGEVLAVVEGNESLSSYEIRAVRAGTVILKHGVAGEPVGEGEVLYEVADLGRVWVDLDVYRRDLPRVKAGQAVDLDFGEGLPRAQGRIACVSPVGSGPAQSVLARVVLSNPDGLWRPGLQVTGGILAEEVPAGLAVKASALQTFRDWTVVFVRKGDVFEIAPVEIGRRDGTWAEVLSGLAPGRPYVTEGSFVVKADVLKSGATHDH